MHNASAAHPNDLAPLEPSLDHGPCQDACTSQSTPIDVRQDLAEFLPDLRDDARAAVNCNNALILGAALAGAIGVRQSWDDSVRDYTAEHPDRWGAGSKFFGALGSVQYQTPALLAVYGYSLYEQDAELHEFTRALLSAYTFTGLTTVGIKLVANTERPTADWNGGQFGFPSFHTSSSFSIAAVVDEYYGHEWGLPAFALASLVGWSRIDERDHDLSDVLFGAALGYVIGKSVAGHRLRGDPRVRLWPYLHPEGQAGVMAELPY